MNFKLNLKKQPLNRNVYIISVISWENDGDNYKTETFKTKDELEALSVAKFLDWLNSIEYDQDGEIPFDEFDKTDTTYSKDDKFNDDLTDDFYRLIGSWDDGQAYRVLDSWSVEYIDGDGVAWDAEFDG